jgi:predicted permease
LGYIASGNFFDLLGIHAALGRGLTKADASNGSSVAVLSDRFWRRQLSGDPAVVGRTLSINQRTVTVVGVMPRQFRGIELGRSPDIYLPMNPASPITWVTFVGRLREGTTLAQTVTQLRAAPQPAEWRFNPTFDCIPLQTAAIPEVSRAGMARFTQLLGAAVGLLLLIGTLTVGMLLLVRTEARRDEFAMCLALGATPARLAAGVAIEGMTLALTGSALGIAVSWWLLAGVRAYQLPGGVDIDLLNLSIDQRALAAAAVAAIVGGIVIALVAGVFGFSANVADTLRSRSGVTARLTRRRTRAALVAAQIAVALVLLSGAGLFARSVKEALHINPGFDTAHTLTGWVSYPQEREAEFLAGLRERLSVNPAIQALSFTYPQGGMTVAGTLAVDGIDRRFPTFVAFNFVDERYFTAMGIHILNGRDFTDEDRATAPRVAIVSESLGRFVGNGGDPLGRRIQDLSPTTTIQVVGVAPDVITRVSALEPLTMYMPIAQARKPRDRDLVVKAADPASAAREITAAVKAGDPSARVSPMLTMDERIAEQMSAQNFGIVIMSALGGIAALLTALGIYVLAESMAVLRIREMGIRAALGATGRQLGAMVLAETARLVGLGIGAGVVISWAGTDLIRSLLFRVQPLDPATIGGVAVVITAIAMLVTMKPALRAARVDLARVLRDE